jgi:thioredoxin 1
MNKRFFFVICSLVLGLLTSGSNLLAADQKIDLPALLARRMPVLLEFGRGWCIPCKYMKPILDDMAKAYTGKAIVMNVDMDANKNLVRDFKIIAMPTQVFLTPEGKEFFRNMGVLERDQIVQVFGKMGLAPPVGHSAAPTTGPQETSPQTAAPIPVGKW